MLSFPGVVLAQSTLADAIQRGDRKTALEMIAKGADVNNAQADGTTPLHWAVYQVDRELVQALIKKGARADVVNRYGSTPLAEAIKVANVPLVELLLEVGANANVANEDGQTALMLAARTGNLAVAEALVREGADVNRRERMRGQSAVMWAAAQNHPEMVAFLVSKGADLSVRADATDWGSQITTEPRVMYRPVGGLTRSAVLTRSLVGEPVPRDRGGSTRPVGPDQPDRGDVRLRGRRHRGDERQLVGRGPGTGRCRGAAAGGKHLALDRRAGRGGGDGHAGDRPDLGGNAAGRPVVRRDGRLLWSDDGRGA